MKEINLNVSNIFENTKQLNERGLGQSRFCDGNTQLQ